MTDPYAYWRAACEGNKPAAHPDDPQPGFYRHPKSRNAVAYWLDNGVAGGGSYATIQCAVNERLQSLGHGQGLWQWVCDHAVTHQDYLFRIKNGRWPNEAEVLIGHNRPPDDGSYESVVSVLDAIEHEARRILGVGSARNQDEADQASDIANELMAIQQKVVAAHRAEKAPVLAEAKRIDGMWFKLRDRAEDLKIAIRIKVVTPFLRERWAAAERRAAEAAAIGATVEAPPPIRAGALKRTTSLRKVITAHIDDYQAVLAFFANNSEVRELVQRLADRAVRAGVGVPGCSTITEEKAV
jgi:hypothetical protein